MCLLFQYPYAIYYCIYLCVNKVENPGPAYWNSLPKWRETRKRVEISGAAYWNSLPKWRETRKMVEIPRPSLLRISTQTTQIGKIGRDSQVSLLEF